MASTVNYTYVYFNITNYAGVPTLSTFTLPNTPLTFYPDFLTSPTLTATDNISNKIIRWDFGDGSFSNSLTAVHTYKWPGDYPVRLTIYDKQGNSFDSSFRPVVQVFDYVYDQLQFEDYFKFIYDVPASKIQDPLVIQRQNSWQSYSGLSATGYTVFLYASGANGQYQNIYNFYDDKWSHLRTLSRFYEKVKVGVNYELKSVDRVTTSNEEIYVRVANKKLELCDKKDSGAVLAGTKGSASVYYVDDVAKNYTSREPPIFVFATLDGAKLQDKYTINNDTFQHVDYPPYSFQNLKPAVLPIIKVRHNDAVKLAITTTGIDGEGNLSATNFNIPEISWQNTEIPFVIRMKDKDYYTTKTYPPLSSSTIYSDLSSLTGYDVQFGIIKQTDTGYQEVTGISYFEDFTIEAPQSIGAFYKGYFIAPETTYNCILTAQVNVVDPLNFPKDSLIGWVALPQYNKLLRFFRQQIYSNCPGYLVLNISASEQFFNSYENRNVYAIQVAPSGNGPGRDYQTWFADGTRNTIFKFDASGNPLINIDLSSAPVLSTGGVVEYVNFLSPVLGSAGPGSITLDRYNDIWVALFDSVSCLKIDGTSGYVKATALPPYNNIVYALSSDYNIPALSGFAGENILLPSSVDTDKDNNLWVSYTHPVSNFLIKYDSLGAPLLTVPFPQLHTPVEICIDRNRFIWLTTYNLATYAKEISARNDFLYKFNSNGTVVPGYPLSGFKLIGNITVDGNQDAWVAHDRDTITRINGTYGTKTDFIAGSGNITSYVESIGGIAVDTSNYLWVINNFNNRMYFIDTLAQPVTSLEDLDYIDISYPITDDNNNPADFEDKQIQAYGDWLGSRWINKHMLEETTIRTITGESTMFNIYPLSGVYNLYKVNEDFDAEGFYKSLIFTENLQDKQVFFEDFLGTIVGGSNAMPYELGKTVYEKIANYVNNVSDIDTANLDQLLSFCDELSIQFEQYNYPFPPQLLRLVNILSIKHKKLWGEQNRYDILFKNKNTSNLTEISTLTSSISCGYPIVAREIFSDIYSVVNTNVINDYAVGYVLPLSDYSFNWGWGLVVPAAVSGVDITDYYKFYEYKPLYDNKFYDNVIDWSNPNNTLSFSNSSFKDWKDDNGIMQNILSYELSKGLRLFLSASDIVYNN